jgi:hypothetical protein
MKRIDNNGAGVAGVAAACAAVPCNLLPGACVNQSKGYIMKNHEKLIPETGNGTIPEHKVTSELTGDLAIDQQAKLVDIRTYRQIFEEGMAIGAFNECENPAQVNKLIGEIKGSGKQCVYMVSEVAHAWDKTTTGWVKKTDEWLAANPFMPGVGHARVKSSAILTTDEIEAINLQLECFAPMGQNPKIAVIAAEMRKRLADHAVALLEDATRQANVRKRAATLETIKGILLANDKTGGKAITLTISEEGVVTVG